MKRIFRLLSAVLTPASAPTAGPDPQHASTLAAKDWLVLIDRGDYHAGWDQAAPSLKADTPRDAWADTIAMQRGTLGVLTLREVTGYQFRPARHGAAHKTVVRFRSQYEKCLLKETVTLELADGNWRTAEYSIG